MRLRVEHSGEKALKISHLTFLAANFLVMILARKFKYSARFGRETFKSGFKNCEEYIEALIFTFAAILEMTF